MSPRRRCARIARQISRATSGRRSSSSATICRRRRSARSCVGNCATRRDEGLYGARRTGATATFRGCHGNARTLEGHGKTGVIWVKTDAGRAEMQSRALVKERARRNLLLLIDGVKTEEMLLANLAGISANDFQELRKLDLIAPASGAVTTGNPARATSFETTRPTMPRPPAGKALDYSGFTTALTKLISSQLGLRGFTLTLAVDKASTIEELRDVAQRVIEQIRDRKGEGAAAEAKRTLYGG